MNYSMKKLSQPLTLGLAMLAGGGLILIAIGLGVGAVGGANADMNVVRGALILGFTLFVFGFGGWLAVVRPWETFDDINQATYTGHHDHAGHDEHAIVPAEPTDLDIHAGTHT